MTEDRVSRRRLLRSLTATAAVGGAGTLAGCSGGSDCEVEGADETVVTGPGNSLIFEPERVTVEVGDTVGWCFESAGHNVSAVPDHSDEVSIPADAEPFASYDGDRKFETDAVGETFSHTFETPGEFTYVCVPHETQGMIGTVVVESG
jgi:plastocyanin